MKQDRQIDPQQYLILTENHERLEFLLRLATFAPSSHNMQPWLFKILGQDILIYPDYSKKLVVADPDARELAITLGSLIESLSMVADSYGLKYRRDISNELTPGHEIALFHFESLNSTQTNSEVLNAVVHRHNSRLVFEQTPLDPRFTSNLDSHIETGLTLTIVTDERKKAQIKAGLLSAVSLAFKDKAFRKELSPWLKPSVGTHEDGLVGSNLGVPFLLSLVFPWLTRFFDISKLQVKIHARMLNDVPSYGIISSVTDSISDWIKVGQSLFRIAVYAEQNQVSMGIMQAAIENPHYRNELQGLINLPLKPQIFFRLGKCQLTHNHSPRRALRKVIIQ